MKFFISIIILVVLHTVLVDAKQGFYKPTDKLTLSYDEFRSLSPGHQEEWLQELRNFDRNINLIESGQRLTAKRPAYWSVFPWLQGRPLQLASWVSTPAHAQSPPSRNCTVARRIQGASVHMICMACPPQPQVCTNANDESTPNKRERAISDISRSLLEQYQAPDYDQWRPTIELNELMRQVDRARLIATDERRNVIRFNSPGSSGSTGAAAAPNAGAAPPAAARPASPAVAAPAPLTPRPPVPAAVPASPSPAAQPASPATPPRRRLSLAQGGVETARRNVEENIAREEEARARGGAAPQAPAALSPAAPPAPPTPPPTPVVTALDDAGTELNTSIDADEAATKGQLACIFSGWAVKNQERCQGVREAEMNDAAGARVLYSCLRESPRRSTPAASAPARPPVVRAENPVPYAVLCNPILFGLKDDKPICVPPRSNATELCKEAAGEVSRESTLMATKNRDEFRRLSRRIEILCTADQAALEQHFSSRNRTAAQTRFAVRDLQSTCTHVRERMEQLRRANGEAASSAPTAQ